MKGMQQQKSQGGPSSGAGLMRFFDVSGGGYEMPPEAVIGIAIGVIVLELILGALI